MPRVDLRRSPPVAPLAASTWIGLLALLFLGPACAGDGLTKLPRLLGGSAADSDSISFDSVERVTYDEWREDVLDCGEGRCQNVYSVIASRRGTLSAQVFAPYGSNDVSDFELVLLDRSGEPIGHPIEPYGRPRKLEAQIDPDIYFLRVATRGESQGRLRYRLVASFAPKAVSGGTTGSSRTGSATLEDETPPAAAASVPVVTSEVLHVEDVEGVPTFVLLDAGSPNVALGMRGRLIDRGNAIGEIVIIEVFPDGSRAQLTGAPTGDFSIDTVADIYDE